MQLHSNLVMWASIKTKLLTSLDVFSVHHFEIPNAEGFLQMLQLTKACTFSCITLYPSQSAAVYSASCCCSSACKHGQGFDQWSTTHTGLVEPSI